MKSKHKDILFFCIKLIVLLLIVWAIYKQLFYHQNIENLIEQFKQRLTFKSIPFFVAALLLVVPNYLCEVTKWRLLMRAFFNITFIKAIKAILVGTAMAIFTSNRIGEYAGRILYVPRKYAVETIAVTIVGSISQMIVIVFFGLISLYFLQPVFNNSTFFETSHLIFLTLITMLAFIILCSIYYGLQWVYRLFDQLNRVEKYLSKLAVFNYYTLKNLWQVQQWAILKYIIFTTQFLLLLIAFGIPFSTLLVFCVMFTFLIQTITPSIAFLEVGIRSNAILFSVGYLSSNSLGILSASLLLWIINLMMPTIIGAMLLFRIKIKNTSVVDYEN